MKKPVVIALKNGPQKQFLNLLDIAAIRFEAADAVIVMGPDEIRLPRAAERVRGVLRERYTMLTLAPGGVSTTCGTSRSSRKPAMLCFQTPAGVGWAVFQRGLQSLSISSQRVTIQLPKVKSSVELTNPLSREDLQMLDQLGVS